MDEFAKREKILLTVGQSICIVCTVFNSRQQPIPWTLLLGIGDTITLAFSFPMAYLIATSIRGIHVPLISHLTYTNAFFLICLTLFLFRRTGLYEWQVYVFWGSLLRRLCRALVKLTLVYMFVRFFVARHPDTKYIPLFLIYLIVSFICVLMGRAIISFIEVKYLREQRIERIAFIGWSTKLAKILKELVKNRIVKVEVVGYFLDLARPHRVPPAQAEYKQLGLLQDLPDVLNSQHINMLVVDQSHIATQTFQQISLLCADCMVSLQMIPWSFGIWADRLSIQIIGGVPVIGISDLLHQKLLNRFLKRSVDIIGSLVGLAISIPIIAVLGVLIWRESPGPIFYRQIRLGRLGVPFEIIKLRSMRLDAEVEKGPVWTVENDPRRLRIGEFMRKWNLDELPQFWNILKGEMSLVGPRPERPEFVKEFRRSVDFYNLRHTCKPGLSGWSAVNGLRGNTSLEDRLDFDLYYIENWSVSLDFKIMLMTLLPPKNAY